MSKTFTENIIDVVRAALQGGGNFGVEHWEREVFDSLYGRTDFVIIIPKEEKPWWSNE